MYDNASILNPRQVVWDHRPCLVNNSTEGMSDITPILRLELKSQGFIFRRWQIQSTTIAFYEGWTYLSCSPCHHRYVILIAEVHGVTVQQNPKHRKKGRSEHSERITRWRSFCTTFMCIV